MKPKSKKPASTESNIPDTSAGSHPNDERTKAWFRLYISGVPPVEIARMHDVAPCTVYRMAKAGGWISHKKKIDQRHYKEIIDGVAREMDQERELDLALKESNMHQSPDGRYYNEVEVVLPTQRQHHGLFGHGPKSEVVKIDGRLFVRHFFNEAEMKQFRIEMLANKRSRSF
jgi:hypothetical protein